VTSLALGAGDMFSTPEAALGVAATVAGFIPGYGQVMAAASIGIEAYAAWQAFHECK